MITKALEQLELSKLPILGKGVWGVVYDCGDGTIFKVTNLGGGVGNGREKIEREVAVLKSLAEVSFSSFAIPKHLNHFETTSRHIVLQMTKISGRRMSASELSRLTPAQRHLISASLTAALLELHSALRRIEDPSIRRMDDILHVVESSRYPFTPADLARVDQAIRLLAKRALPTTLIHGDFNISNILLNESLQVTGILDFAETCLGELEDDLVSLTSDLPGLEHALLAAFDAGSRPVDPLKYSLAAVKRNLIGLVLQRYHLRAESEALISEEQLDRALQAATALEPLPFEHR
ncbi:MAG: phosphotransferase [Deltaproteobacteria bacterium]|nr:phosphotransferase [Deltaproteobacteria bacterium]